MKINNILTIVTALGLPVVVICTEVIEAYEGRAIKEHLHSHYDYQYVGNSNLMAISTSAGTTAISGDGFQRFVIR